MMYIGAVLIGIGTAAAGYPVFSVEKGLDFSALLLNIVLVLLWNFIYRFVKEK